MKLILIGYMGSGKTTIGKQLAKSLNCCFKDLDQVIENEEQQPIAEIFSKKGEIYFRKKERKILEAVIVENSNIVIATGGGTPCFGDTIEFMNSLENTITIYLKATNEELTERLFDEKMKRPLISHIKTKELLNDFIRKHLFERSYFYNQSKIKITTSSYSMEDLIEEIKNRINF